MTVTGLNELRQAIDRLPSEVTEALKTVARRNAFLVKERAQEKVPVDTGYTRDNIHVIEDPEHKQYIVSAGTDRPRVIISLHTSRKTGRQHTQAVTVNMLPIWLERGTRYMVARPFMRPAGDSVQPAYRSEMADAARRTAERMLVK